MKDFADSAERAPNEPIPVSAVPRGQAPNTGRSAQPAFDAWTALDILLKRWHWLFLGGVVFAAGFYMLASKYIKPKFTATAQLLRYETPGERDFFTEAMSAETFSALIKSPELLWRIGSELIPPIPPEKFVKFIKVEPEPETDVIKIFLAGRNPNFAVDVLNSYASNAVSYARDWYAQRARVVATEYLRREVEEMDKDIKVLDEQFRNLHLPPELNSKLAQVGGALNALTNSLSSTAPSASTLARQRERLDNAMSELSELLEKFTDIHPRVIAKQEQIKDIQSSLKTSIASAATNNSISFAAPVPVFRPMARPGDAGYNPEIDIVRMKLMALEQGRVNVAERHRQAEAYAVNPPGVVRVFAPATLQGVETNKRPLKIGIVSAFGGVVGVLAMLLLIMLIEVADGRLCTTDDVKRVTRLPVLTTLGDLRKMSPDSRSQWAFRTWTMLQGRLSPSANHGLVCGITSSAPGEGRSTWIRLLAEAASMTGFRVLTIATKPSPTSMQLTEGHGETPKEARNGKPPSKAAAPNGTANGQSSAAATANALTTSVLTSPAQVTEQLTGPNCQPMVHIPLPGWVWNLDRRKQWGEALSQWRQIDNLVILVELPPASVPEAVLLGSNLPNLLWLANSGTAEAGTTRTQLETLRNARCNLVGAVLNRERRTPMKRRFPRWFGASAVSFLMAQSSGPLLAQISATPPTAVAEIAASANTNANAPGRFSIVNREQRAAWQQRLTLGPGDVLNLALYGEPDLARAEVVIGPDGRLGYLEAQDVMAAGLTVDELRNRLNDEIGKYRRAARTMLTPVAFRSKKYYVLGKVMTKGVYTLDRPLTVIEAIARAHGLENGLVDRNVIDLADFQRSFLIRGGTRIPLNFERLFQQGDLSQNIAVEPGDYLYFASAEVKEVYVVGEVRLPGAVVYNPETTIISAISTRGGFTERAFKSRVLVVRGSLDHPEPIVVDTAAIVTARGLDFTLKPNDIIYVNSRPFIRAEELADVAATAFLQSLITSWVGVNVVKPIP